MVITPASKKILVVNVEKCSGCRICEITCSLHHEGEVNRKKSRIRVKKRLKLGLDIPIVCQQCEEAYCEKVCPTGAIARNDDTGAMTIDESCVGCRLCINSCPIGAPSVKVSAGKVMNCDLCGGDPICVKYCPEEALEYVVASKDANLKKSASMSKLRALVRELALPRVMVE